MTKCILGITILLALAITTPSFAAGLEEMYIYPYVEYFSWREYSDGGSRIVKESGPIFGAGSAATLNLYGKSLILRGKAEIFGGQVDYDGQTQQDINPARSELPVKTDVAYFGGKLETDLGWRFSADSSSIEPFFGLGYRGWSRDLKSSSTTDRNGNPVFVGSSQETWHTLYTRFGLRGDYDVTNAVRIFAEAGAKYPLLNRNEANVAGSDVTVKPEQEWSAFAEAGLRYKWFRPSVYYEGFRFRRSPDVHQGGYIIWQPKSESDIVGLSLGIMFR